MQLPPLTRILAASLAVSACGLLGACTSISRLMSDGISSVITPYKVEIVQGNVVTTEQLERIKPGRSRNDVREALGSPLLADPFHADRWDYVFTLRRKDTEPQRRSVVVFFEGDLVKTVQAPADLPSERDFVSSISRPSSKSGTAKLELSAQERAALPQPQAKPVAQTSANAPQGAQRIYPPLEAL